MKKRTLPLMLSGALLLVLCACGPEAEGTAPTDTATAETSLLDLLADVLLCQTSEQVHMAA